MKLRRITRSPRKFAQERWAYERWVPRLSPFAPHLIHVENDPPVLIVTELSGRSPSELSLTVQQEREVHRKAGALLSRLHCIVERDSDSLKVEEALILRAHELKQRSAQSEAEGPCEEAIDRLTSALAVICGSPGRLVRVPCHRDFEPRNWLVQLGPPLEVSVVDFEHARMDLALADFSRLRCLVWPARPDLRHALFDGYGARFTEDEHRLLDALAWLDAVGTLVWGLRNGVQNFVERGYSMIEQLGV